MRPPQRLDGFAPIESYAAIGDGQTVALVALDGAIDWLPIPGVDGVTIFGSLLDVERGGSFALHPVGDYEVERRYRPDTNLLETTYTTRDGVVTITDVLSLQDGGQLSWIELVRRVQGRRGRVRLRYELQPRLDFGHEAFEITERAGAYLISGGGIVVSFRAWDAGAPSASSASITGEVDAREGSDAVLACTCVKDELIALPSREEIEIRLERTADAWQRWVDFHTYEGEWRQAVDRSALALKLLIRADTGAMTAAATSSLPERIGGDLNWDYRFAWLRDSAFVLDALGHLGYREQVHASLSWLLRATDATHPRLHAFFRLDGSVPAEERDLDLTGYRGSRPVRSGNGALEQLQLGTYGDLLSMIQLYVRNGNALDELTGVRLAEIADHVCRVWEREDSGIWELDDLRHYTNSKINCWVALDRALSLASAGEAPADHADRWREECARIRAWIDERCWSERRDAYNFYAGTDDLDASVLLAVHVAYLPTDDGRLHSTVDAIRRELDAGGPLLYRYSGSRRVEGAFVACSFWLAEAYARLGRLDEARETMTALLELANDVGLYAEQIDPETKAFLGNFPQALTHLSLINAAIAIECETEDRRQ
jgi:GH15 family glucan-1,4-alpha-glucosidase